MYITILGTPPHPHEVADLLPYISCEWKLVASYLRISNSTIERSTDDDCIKMNHVIKGVNTCTLEVISDTAHIVDNKELLQKLYSKFAVPVNTSRVIIITKQ